jgi:hypothetical protein
MFSDSHLKIATASSISLRIVRYQTHCLFQKYRETRGTTHLDGSNNLAVSSAI